MNRALLAELEVYTAKPEAFGAKVEEKPIEAPIKLKVNAEKVQLRFTNAALRSIFQALGKHAGVNFLYDEQFRDVPLTIDLADRTFEQAVSFLCLASKNFSRPIDEKTVIIVPDQPMKRLQYELNAIRTFYLSNLNAQEVQNSLAMMIRTQYKAPSIIVDKNLNSITVRDTPYGREPGREAPPDLGQVQGRGHHRPRDHGGLPHQDAEVRDRPQPDSRSAAATAAGPRSPRTAGSG